ncbi:PREDICTED: uncharacterized protein LOC108554134 [Eufriesea mexicana]|uniref:uncharacterized protein LOC108554134 n=1 Tax=Eufriesea mexicana TaxID=516756 RepID=UPI00083BEB59|nr:PREDICTED: uncharacterized protein LOC108554134 [Eufriesea mexicana]
MGNGIIPLMVVAMVPIIAGTIGQRALNKRNAPTNLDYPDYPTKYDEYPVVMPKRAALLFDQIMVALQKVVDNQGREELGGSRTFTRSSGAHLPSGNSQIVPSADEQTVKMDLQRRGQAKGRVYWRCYFNAVTCFKRK